MLFIKLSLFYYFYFASVGVYVIFLPKILSDIGYSAINIGIVFAIAPLIRFLMPFIFLKHIKLTQNIFKLALILSIVFSSLFYVTIEHFYLFLINNALLASCLSLILPYLEVTAVEKLGKERYGKSRLYGSLGFMSIGLILAKFLDDPYVAIDYYLVLNILTAFFSLLLLKYDTNHTEEKQEDDFDLLSNWAFWLSLFTMQVGFGAFYNFFTIYETAHNISLEMTSYLWAFGVICEVLMLYFQAPILKNNLLTLIKISLFITIIRWLILYLYPDNLTLTFISQSMHAFSFGLYHSCVVIYLFTIYKNKKLAQQFMYGVAYGLGGFFGSIIAGLVYGKYLFLFSAFFTLISLIALFFIKEKFTQQ